MIATVGALQEAPARAGETRWPHAVLHADRAGDLMLTVADTVTELLGALIPGYADMPGTPQGDVQALAARYDHAVAVATAVQADVACQAVARGTLDPAAEDEDTLTALFADRTEPMVGAGRPTGDSPTWSHEVPLVLIGTDYAPFTDRGRPTGRIIWLDPSTETGYLYSLAEVGMVRYLAAD